MATKKKTRRFAEGGYSDQEASDLMNKDIVPTRASTYLASSEPTTKQSAADQRAEDAAMARQEAREARKSTPVAKVAPKTKASASSSETIGDQGSPKDSSSTDYSDQNSRSVRGEKRFTGKETKAESDVIDRMAKYGKEQEAAKKSKAESKNVADTESAYPKEKAPVYKLGDEDRNGPIGDTLDYLKKNSEKKVPQRFGKRYEGQDGKDSKLKFKSGGSVKSGGRGDGLAQRGRTKGTMR